MRFLLDQDVYAVTCRLLRGLGHDVVTAADMNLSHSPDTGLLMRAAEEKRLFVTRDKDFGGLVFVERLSKGVLFLRISASADGSLDIVEFKELKNPLVPRKVELEQEISVLEKSKANRLEPLKNWILEAIRRKKRFPGTTG